MDKIRKIEIEDYEHTFHENNDRLKAVLLGAGFSRQFDENLRYETLYDRALELKPEKRQILESLSEGLQTKNFEDFMLSIESLIRFVNLSYRQKLSEIERLKALLNEINEIFRYVINYTVDRDKIVDKISIIGNFLLKFDYVFTLNYDPIIYWSLMNTRKIPLKKEDGKIQVYQFADYFKDGGTFDPLSEVMNLAKIKRDKTIVHYLHGSQFLITKKATEDNCQIDKVFKISSKNGNDYTNLLKEVQQSLQKDKNATQIIISEGNYGKKLERIYRNPYLTFVFNELGNFNERHEYLEKENRVLYSSKYLATDFLIYGFSASDQDKHVIEKLCELNNTTFTLCTYELDEKSVMNKYNNLINEIDKHNKCCKNDIDRNNLQYFDITDKAFRSKIFSTSSQ
jgi:hypothetical protein